MRDPLPESGPNNKECVIVNLEGVSGTHWSAYKGMGGSVRYFDSFCDLAIIYKEDTNYKFLYNSKRQQNNRVWCGLMFEASPESVE